MAEKNSISLWSAENHFIDQMIRMDQLCKILSQKIRISKSYNYFLLPHNILRVKKC